MSLAFSCLKRRISLPGGRTVFLRAPTVRQVVEIVGVMKNMRDHDDLQLLFELLGDLPWEGAIDIQRQLWRLYKASPSEFAQRIKQILMQGYQPKQKVKEEDNDLNDADTYWKMLIAEYSRTLGKDAFTIYDETPFPFFMEMIASARREEARRHINAASENAFAMGGSEEVMNEWNSRANGEEQKPDDEFFEDISQQEIDENFEQLKKRMNQ